MKINLLLLILLLHAVSILAQDAPKITFSPKAGFYGDTSLSVKIICHQKKATIYYTTNGATPSSQSTRYQNEIWLDTTHVLRAVAYIDGQPTKVITSTYFLQQDTILLPVLSVSIPAAELFDSGRGLFKRGYRASNRFPFKGANFYSRREVPCTIEIFETNKKKVWESKVGFKIFGGMSRIFPQKSFSLYASKSKYGDKYIKYPIFKDKKLSKYKRLVLRNSGSDYGETHFRDALITSFGREMGLETQSYRPAVVYINGQYWGLYNFREKLTRHYISGNCGYHKDSIDLIEHRKGINAGSRKHYDQMRTFMRQNNLAKAENFDHIANMMDIDNFMEYQILQIYIDNQDAGGNIKFWRPQIEGGRWRWILFDTDFGLGHYGKKGYTKNSLEFHTKVNGPHWPNPPWSTLNLRSLLQNKDFQVKFVTRFLDRMNYTLDSTRIKQRIDEYADGIRNEMPRHWAKWNLPKRRWYREIKRMKEFSVKRPFYIRKFLKERFSWVGQEVVLTTSIDSGGGQVIINDVIPVSQYFEGIYFQKTPVYLEAKPYFGYVFSHWEINGEMMKDRKLTVRFGTDQQNIKAIFQKGKHPQAAQIIINEIGFRDTSTGDWIEFYNSTEKDLDLTDWKLVNSKGNSFIFPNISIKAESYLVICHEEEKFKKVFSTCKNYIGNLSFKLGNHKEKIMLYDTEGLPVDSIGYHFKRKNAAKYKTLVLKDFSTDNNNISNWKKGTKNGSPASVNPEYLELEKVANWNQFIKLTKMGGIAVGIFMAILFAYVSVKKRLKKKP